MSDEVHHRNTPRVPALEYTRDVIRACREAGASPQYNHITTIHDKLMEETVLPRLRVFQLLSKLAEARAANTDVTLSVDEVNVILQAAREFK